MPKEQNEIRATEPEILVNEVIVEEKNGGNNNFLGVAIITAAIIIAGTLIYLFGPKNIANTTPTSITNTVTTAAALPDFPTSLPYQQTKDSSGRVVLGNPKAPVTIIEYGDYQCTYCGLFFNQTEPSIRENYVATGKAKIVFKNLIVIDNFAPGAHESHDAALAASCAADQNKFWEYSDAIFTIESKDGRENSGNLTRDLFLQIADKLGMSRGQFTICFDSQKYGALITADIKDAGAIFSKISTPSFTINGTAMQGAQPYSIFSKAIDEALVKAGGVK